MSVTLSEIAEASGFSLSTVSNVLRNGERAQRYSDKTRSTVVETAESLGYRPNFFASQLQKQNRRLVMLAFSSLRDSFAGSIAESFGVAIATRGYGVLAGSLSQRGELDLLDSIVGPQGVLALAVIGGASSKALPDSKLIEWVKAGVKIVSIGRSVRARGISQVLYDNEGGVLQAISHLHEQGARTIWLLGDRPSNQATSVVGQRLDLAREMVLRHGLPEPYELPLAENLWHPVRAELAMAQALSDRQAPDAIFCSSDYYAMGAMKALRAAGLLPGQDVAIVGFNDTPTNSFMEPALTSVKIPTDMLGRLAANQLIDAYEGLTESNAVITLDTELQVRQSSIFVHKSHPTT